MKKIKKTKKTRKNKQKHNVLTSFPQRCKRLGSFGMEAPAKSSDCRSMLPERVSNEAMGASLGSLCNRLSHNLLSSSGGF